MRNALATLLGMLAVTTIVLVPSTAHAQERNPVLFVHGYSGSAGNWDSMVDDFVADGWDSADLYPISYDYDVSNKETAEVIESEVDAILAETGQSQVDIVSHSMGALSSRWYLQFLDGHENVDNYVSLAAPNQGSEVQLPCVVTTPSCQEVVAGSDFLAQLNGADVTPGDVDITTFRSWCDFLMRPTDTGAIPGADNRTVSCVTHTGFLSDDDVSSGVREALGGSGT